MKYKTKYLKNVTLVFVSIFTLMSCGGNILTGMADKSPDEAIIFDIKELSNKGNFEEALTKFTDLSAIKLAERDTQFLKAKVYAGLCGFDFLGFLSVLGQMGGATTFFKILFDASLGRSLVTFGVFCFAASGLRALGGHSAYCDTRPGCARLKYLATNSKSKLK